MQVTALSDAEQPTLPPAAPALARQFRASLDSPLFGAVAHAAAALARLDQALSRHPLLPAFLYRARLDAVRQQAEVDGLAIDPWHLAALLEGLRPRLDRSLGGPDRGTIIDAARAAFTLHQWLAAPDFDQEGDIRQAMEVLATASRITAPLLAAPLAFRNRIEAGGSRAPMRAALIRHWTAHRLLRMPVPLTGAAAFRAETAWAPELWIPTFLVAVACEADAGFDLLIAMEHAWRTARCAVAGQRRTSQASRAVDLLAALPLVSATTLARSLGIAIKSALRLLDSFCEAGIAVEVTHRSARRLFGMTSLAPLRDGVRPPRRPGGVRGRPPASAYEPETDTEPLPLPAITPIERRRLDYAPLEAVLAEAEQTIRRTGRSLDAWCNRVSAGSSGTGPEEGATSVDRADE